MDVLDGLSGTAVGTKFDRPKRKLVALMKTSAAWANSRPTIGYVTWAPLAVIYRYFFFEYITLKMPLKFEPSNLSQWLKTLLLENSRLELDALNYNWGDITFIAAIASWSISLQIQCPLIFEPIVGCLIVAVMAASKMTTVTDLGGSDDDLPMFTLKPRKDIWSFGTNRTYILGRGFMITTVLFGVTAKRKAVPWLILFSDCETYQHRLAVAPVQIEWRPLSVRRTIFKCNTTTAVFWKQLQWEYSTPPQQWIHAMSTCLDLLLGEWWRHWESACMPKSFQRWCCPSAHLSDMSASYVRQN